MKLRSVIRPKDNPGDRREIEAEAPSYAEAVALLDEQTPAGWIRLFVMTVA